MIRGTVSALKPEANGLAFNIGSNRPIQVLALARMIIAMTGSTSSVQLVPYEKAYGKGYEDMRARIPDLTRSNGILGFDPQVALEEGLARTIAWSRKHKT